MAAVRKTDVPSGANILLACLVPADRTLLALHLEEVAVFQGASLLHADQPIDAVYFPQTITASIEQSLEGARPVETAIVGREGMIGWPALLGCDVSPHAAVVHAQAGTALRIAVAPLHAACRQSPTLAIALLRFVHVVMIQMSCAIASHLQHSLERRVARWLLMQHDRVGGDILRCRHEEIAHSLNVRRASITDQFHLIEGERLIHCTRGRVAVRDRGGLEALAGEAYGLPERHYSRLVAPFGKSARGMPERASPVRAINLKECLTG